VSGKRERFKKNELQNSITRTYGIRAIRIKNGPIREVVVVARALSKNVAVPFTAEITLSFRTAHCRRYFSKKKKRRKIFPQN